ncbi:MAG: ECF transporter S component [Erysipelotrichaceae bacterium]|nr:ECF transporter S component [Erysipelotrichaceae bacterium]
MIVNKNSVSNITKAALFLAIGQVLPFITGQIPQIGVMLSPMHFPVLLCGFFCGWKYGMIVGLICPLLRSVLFGFPVMFPMAIGMAFELMTYGFVSGLLAEMIGTDKLAKIYVTLIIAMISGRIVWGLAQMVLLGITGGQFTFAAFLAGALLNAIPGIILQLILIPLIVNAFSKFKSA